MSRNQKKFRTTVRKSITSIEFQDTLGIEATTFDKFVSILAAMDESVKLESTNFTVRKCDKDMLHVSTKIDANQFLQILTSNTGVNIKYGDSKGSNRPPRK